MHHHHHQVEKSDQHIQAWQSEIELYAKSNLVNKNISTRNIEEFSSKINWQPNASVADIGTGPGNIFVENILPLIPNYKKALGIDLSKQMIEFANHKYADLPNLKFIVGDIEGEEEQYGEYESSFDYITSFLCLMLIKDQE